MGEVRFGPGEVVFHEGEPSTTVLLIKEGEVEVAKSGRRTPLRTGWRGGTSPSWPGPRAWRCATTTARWARW